MNIFKEKILKAIEWRRTEADSGNRWVIWGIPIASIFFVVLMVSLFAKLANANSGFVSAIGLFLVVPLSVFSSNVLQRQRNQRKAAIALNVLMQELWHNLNYVSQIERSYENNIPMISSLEDDAEPLLAIPHYGPRIAVIEKFVDEEHLFNLNDPLPLMVSEIYAQLVTLREEFVRWREILVNKRLDRLGLYKGVSSTMLSIVDPAMRNMVKVWVSIVNDIGMNSSFPQIYEAGRQVRESIADGRSYITAYKSSWVQGNVEEILSDGVIICWMHDWTDAPCEVLELSQIAALHPTWLQSE